MGSAWLALPFVVWLASAGQEPAASEVEAGRQALRTLAKVNENLRVLRADYLQERTSALIDKPLVSRGTLWLRREPACVVFLVTEPREARIRLDERSYQVWRPREKQAERFRLESPQLARALLGSIVPRDGEIEQAFAIHKARRAGDEVTLELRPRRPEVEKVVTRLELTLRADGSAVTRVAYDDAQGDRVDLRITKPQRDPEPPAGVFDAELPKDVRLLEHR